MAKLHVVDRLYGAFVRAVASGTWAPGERVPSMRDLARQFDASRASVNVAISKAARQGLFSIQRRVGAVVSPEGPQRAQRLLGSLTVRSSGARLAILVPAEFFPLSGGAPDYAHMTAVVAQEATTRGVRTRILPIERSDQVALARSVMRRYDAVLLLGIVAEHLPILFPFAQTRFPAVVYNRRIPGIDLPAVMQDAHGASRRLGEVLHGLGHRDMCLVASPRYVGLYGHHGHVEGWLDFLKEADLLDECSMPILYFERGYFPLVLDRILRLMPKITALVVGLSPLLSYIADNPRFHHLDIPGRLSVATFGSVRHVRWPSCYPPVTSFELDLKRMAECVMDTVTDMLAGAPAPPSVRVPLHLIQTDSIGPAP